MTDLYCHEQGVNLKASNGQVIGSSEMYETSASMENGIRSVMNNALKAQIADNS